MRLPALLISDLHLTANPADEYRWGLFKWIVEQSRDHDFKHVYILGDLTDAKDHHPSTLTNRVVQSICMLTWIGLGVTILQGNHDYLKKGESYFAFLREIPGVQFITEPCWDEHGRTLLLPHTRTPSADWEHLQFEKAEYVLMHQTVHGSKASNGQIMEGDGVPMRQLQKAGYVFSGDIHVPQVISGVEYVGSPYHVHFGDRFKPRALLLDDQGGGQALHFKTISRFSVQLNHPAELDDLLGDLRAGDQVKVTANVPEADLATWSAYRREIVERIGKTGAELCGLKLSIQRSGRRFLAGEGGSPTPGRLSDPDAISRFVERQELGGDALEAGLELLK